jgi:hypothetical protein
MYKKLLIIQQEIGKIKKDATNPFFKSKYFDINSLLEHVKPVLNASGIVLLQGLTNIGGKLALSTQLVEVETGDKIEYVCPLPEGLDAQKSGSSVTYFRRYSIQSLLALEAEDDDGNVASSKAPEKYVYENAAAKKARQEQNKKDFNNNVSPF